MFARVLLPIGQSREELAIALSTIELAKSHNSKVFMVSIVPDQDATNSLEAKDSTNEEMRSIQQLFDQSGIFWDLVHKKGDPVCVICDIADELNVDVIVMGIKTMEKSSNKIVSRVIQFAPCPVFVVP